MPDIVQGITGNIEATLIVYVCVVNVWVCVCECEWVGCNAQSFYSPPHSLPPFPSNILEFSLVVLTMLSFES